jgi:hypothetical protein
MKSTLLLVQNIVTQTESPDEVIEWVNDVRQSLEAAFEAITEGKAQ